MLVRSVRAFRDLHDIVLYDVRVTKYTPTKAESVHLQALGAYIPVGIFTGKILMHNIFNLPT